MRGPLDMPFSTLLFVCAFLPACCAAYWLCPRPARNSVLFVFSLAFYAWGAPRFLPVILGLGVGDFILARFIAKAEGRAKKLALGLGLSCHLSILAWFKYANFGVAEMRALGHVLGMNWFDGWVPVVLPIGISFLTFEEISYLVDVYRGDATPARRWSHYLLFLMLFPHSIAGPIFRWKDLANQFDDRPSTIEAVSRGVARFSLGLAKKILVADSVAYIADVVFGLPLTELTPTYAWIGAAAYTIQIYFDFSGYSDMAIGLGAIFGFNFKENFDAPYSARSLGEFWQRWHISLSSWLRDYLYVSLGGNRRGPKRAAWNALAVFAVSGIWHGAAWTFLTWGLYHGVLVALERRAEPALARVPPAVRALGTFIVVVVGWVFFRAATLGRAFWMIATMFGLRRGTIEAGSVDAQLFPRFGTLVLALALAFVVARMLFRYSPLGRPGRDRRLHPALSAALFALACIHMANMQYAPLIYFKF